MSVIENLLHISRRQCDERRRYLTELQALAERLRADAARLRIEIERAGMTSTATSATTVEGGEVIPDSLLDRSLFDRQQKLDHSVAEIEIQIVAATEALVASEQELKRHELAFAQRASGNGAAARRPMRRFRPLPPG